MTPARFHAITQAYPRLKLAVAGDFCLDRYLEIDPSLEEISLETKLPVYNVRRVRSQAGGAGTILNNLAALGVGELYPAGFCGRDGEGFELREALGGLPGVRLDYFIETAGRRTFTYCKPLVVEPGRPPRELNRLDSKNWSPTPAEVASQLGTAVMALAERMDGMALLSQVDVAETGVLSDPVLSALREALRARPGRLVIADSRRTLGGFPPVIFKMNAVELTAMTGTPPGSSLADVGAAAVEVAQRNDRPVFVTLAERGLLGASPDGLTEHMPARPVRGPIDIVGAGDAVTANLLAGLAAGADLREALELAGAAASVVIHQLGTTGTATVAQIRDLLFPARGAI